MKINFLLDILFPKKCVGCKKVGSYFCQSCVRDIKQTDLVCPRCEKLSIGGQTHLICKRKFGLDGLWSLGVYQDSLRSAISQLKYKPYVKDLAEILVDIVLEYWAKYQPFLLDQIKKDRGEGWVVIPVPLHWWRENDRGFNQSSLIGKLLAEKLGLEYLDSLKRVRYTKSQVKLKSGQRRENIHNAFTLSTNYPLPASPKLQRGEQPTNCLLIDDVWTTGSTLRECCYILKRAGAKKVWALTLAR